MRVIELIEEVNEALNKNLNVYSNSSDIPQIENQLKTKLRRYVKNIEELQSELFNQARLRRTRKITIDYRAYVACAIGATYKGIGTFGSSHGMLNNYGSFILLLNRLKHLGNVGHRSSKYFKGGKNFIGKCAEIKASYALHKKNRITNLKSIEFTKAYRPRTMQVIERCDNCKYVFGNV
ncbi:MAG: hypothetical protein QM710_14215 [Flavobacterium sp.]